jgi:hypothetical protein
MTITDWLALGAGGLLAAFVAFAFRQGLGVKPTGRNTRDNVADAVDLSRDADPR